jgi:hypothetical protein
MRIINWSLQGVQSSPYDAPETRVVRISGQVFGHPKFYHGKRITTSNIVSINGCEITTLSGSVYQLGRPDEKYVEWCREQGCHIPTEEEPIKI